MMKVQTPERIKWEESVLQNIVASGVCRSDAQSLVETAKGEALLDSSYLTLIEPAVAAQRFFD